MLISQAYAQAAGGGAGGAFDIMSLLPLVLIFVVFYFLLIRPQQKKMKQHRSMIEAVKRGDIVTLGGGIVGKVTKVVDDGHVEVEIAEGVRVKVLRATLSDVRGKTEVVKDEAKADSATK
ncbi:MAG: preprotein translocase subunit YajC [Dechloromonas sp.]|nr:MAG: preprotein translocase subunit YajC [Dechloromonas sp.]